METPQYFNDLYYFIENKEYETFTDLLKDVNQKIDYLEVYNNGVEITLENGITIACFKHFAALYFCGTELVMPDKMFKKFLALMKTSAFGPVL